MISGFLAKLATAVVVIFLVTDASALLPDEGGVGEKSLSNVFNCGSSSRKTFPGKESSSFGCENMVISGKGNVPFRDLRSLPWKPPSPLGNGRKSQVFPSPPPII